ncbi:LysR family transcriptional regulator [Acerihabitans arboris]|uniref:LysR family transcriptional regulator n=1 Tax=Acerihabitans arboris TaxID=2691583 RepID=A0A845SPU1_9GAMM|nr:LysR family transcriptional regulator [Acerihabitans arboris]NDL64946.1 LysR family transcriptional regulator [Acerihabitans arboris]
MSDLRLFIEAAMLGSFSAAGRKLGCSPAAASACIVRLETGLKVRLFERTTRQLRLTDEGKLFLSYSQRALEQFNDVTELLQSGKDEIKGTIRISAPSDFGRNRLVSELEGFRHDFPCVSLILSLTDSISSLIGDDIDIAIRYGQPVDSSMTARKLAESHRVVCAAPSLLARLGKPPAPISLQGLPTIVLLNAAGRQDQWSYRDETNALQQILVTPTHTTNDGDISRKWAIMGYGFAYKSILDIRNDLAEGRLATVLDDYFIEPAPLYALFNRNKFQPPRMKRLLDFLFNHLT